MDTTLLLNATFEPLKIIPWQKAMVLWCQSKVEIVSTHDRELRAVTFSFKVPAVVRLLRFVRVRRRLDYVPFSRANIYARDRHTCQYCGDAFASQDLTFDHVVPITQGGGKSWENIVTACLPCNRRKGGRTPAEAGLTLRALPKKPKAVPALRITLGIRETPEAWRDYLYWNVELDEEA